MVKFVKNTLSHGFNALRKFVRGLWEHAEGVVALVLASLGLNMLLSEIPFIWALPMWIEAPMVIPVLSVLGIGMLMRLGSHRAERRLAIG